MSDEVFDPPLWVKRQILRDYVDTFNEFPPRSRYQLLALCAKRLPFLAKVRLAFSLLVS